MSAVEFTSAPRAGNGGETRRSLARLRRLDRRSAVSRRVESLISTYRKALGSAQIDAGGPFLAERLRVLAELQTLAECMRQDGLAGRSIDALALIRIENRAARMAVALGLGGIVPDMPDHLPDQTPLSASTTAQIAELFKPARRRRSPR